MSFEVVKLSNANRVHHMESKNKFVSWSNKPKYLYKKATSVETLRLKHKLGYNLDITK